MIRLLVLLFALLKAMPVFAESVTQRDDLNHLFRDAGVVGTFAMLDIKANELTVINAERANRPFIPASSFKIANSLIALETGVIADENEIIPYGGKPQFIKAWERDMDLRDAIRVSNVPVYQEIARRVGLARYTDWLEKLGYGNGKVGKNVERFWLDGPLKISATNQVRFLAELATGKLPVSGETMEIVADITIVGRKGTKILHGKSGWTLAPDPDIGWYVGWVEHQDQLHSFALNIDMPRRSDVPKREELALKLLRALEVF